ncbi:MAG TPA: 50S ribosomal protein L5 [Chloroflexota bacterium]|nr:50S ribosomal protein L5 [Chloroflexota bacterium]
MATTAPTIPRLKEKYQSDVVPALTKEFDYPNRMAVPTVKKITLNIGLGEALTNPRALDAAVADLATISGQKPVVTKAKKSIAQFKIREGNPIGAMVTLRGDRMWEFLDRLISVALPRIRDFQGLPEKGFDGHGNYSLGLREQLMFPEIDYDKIDRVRGLQLSIVTDANTDREGLRLLQLLGMPFRG